MKIPKSTYGQLKEDGTPYTWIEFDKEVGKRLDDFILLKRNLSHLKMTISLFKKGYSISDVVSFIILKG